MVYDEESNCYYCKNNKVLTSQYEKKLQAVTIEPLLYTNMAIVRICPYKTECIKGNNCKTPMKERQKVLYVSKKR